MKFCIIGNSHCNALKHASDQSAYVYNGDFTFITAPGVSLNIKIEDDYLHLLSENNYLSYASGVSSPVIRISDYDAFAVVGLYMTVYQAVRLHSLGYHLFGFDEDNGKLISRAAFKEAVLGFLTTSPFYAIAKKIREKTDKAIYFVPQPIPVQKIVNFHSDSKEHSDFVERWRPVFNSNLASELDAIFEESMHEVAKALEVEFLQQPTVTRDVFFTKNEFQLIYKNSFSSASSTKQDIEDLVHMNADYGHMILNQIVERFAAHQL